MLTNLYSPMTTTFSRSFSLFSSHRPMLPSTTRASAVPSLFTPNTTALVAQHQEPLASDLPNIMSPLDALQKRFKARGHTYQPSTLKRKRQNGFLARLRSRGGKKILARRKLKGRWYLSH